MIQYGKINLGDPAVKKRLIRFIQDNVGEYEITMAKISPERSDQSNKRYFAILREFGDYCGYTELEMHDEMKLLFARIMKLNPKATVSTADMSQREFNRYVDVVHEYLYRFFSIDGDEIRNP